jgi:hypothetical protein
MGYVIKGNRGSDKAIEQDTISCIHCQRVIVKGTWQGSWCNHCGAPICVPCRQTLDKEGCIPWKKWVDELVSHAERVAALTRG